MIYLICRKPIEVCEEFVPILADGDLPWRQPGREGRNTSLKVKAMLILPH